MLLYHYSSLQYTRLETKRFQNTLTTEQINVSEAKANEMGEVGAYIDHISLFIEPIPLDTIAGIFNNQHEFWKSGSQIYEHLIDTSTLPKDLKWSIVETPEIDAFTDQFNWTTANVRERVSYIRQMNSEMLRLGLSGKGVVGLVKSIKPYLGGTETAYINSRARSDAADTIRQYAANVPHLMVYPSGGFITVKSSRLVTLGNKRSKE